MKNSETSEFVHDAIVAGGLISAPAWAPSLSNINDLLTTSSLTVGLLLGIARLWLFFRQRKKHD